MATHVGPAEAGKPPPGSGDAPPPDDERARWRSRRARLGRHLSVTLPGCWGALAFACLSFTPSLLPRDGLLQGLLCGINAAIGYGLGVLGASIWRAFAARDSRTPRPRAWRVFYVTAAVLFVAFLHAGAVLAGPGSARDVRHRLQRPAGDRLVVRCGGRLLAAPVDRSGPALDVPAYRTAARPFSVRNTDTAEGVHRPTSSLRSGGPASLIPWDTLGRQVQPDWLAETPGNDVLMRMLWMPFVTFWQVSADLPFAIGAPGGHGHRYTTEYVEGWRAVLPPTEFSQQKLANLRKIISTID